MLSYILYVILRPFNVFENILENNVQTAVSSQNLAKCQNWCKIHSNLGLQGHVQIPSFLNLRYMALKKHFKSFKKHKKIRGGRFLSIRLFLKQQTEQLQNTSQKVILSKLIAYLIQLVV